MRSRLPALVLLSLTMLAAYGCAPGAGTPRGSGAVSSHWLPYATTNFATIGDDAMFTVIANEDTDLFVHEQDAGAGRRLTWIVRVPHASAMDEPILIHTYGHSTAHAWVLDEIDGLPSELIPASGSVVLHNRSDGSASATVVLTAAIEPASAGRASPRTITLTRRDQWARSARDANRTLIDQTRSGGEVPEKDEELGTYFGNKDK